MRPTIAISPLLACCLIASISSAAPAQQRPRDRIAQLLEQHRRPDAPATLPAGTQVQRDIRYGPDLKQGYDVYLPALARPHAPILVMVHGGGWRRGDKASPGVVGNKAAYWLKQGFVFVSINNRLLPEADPLTQAHDVAKAVASVQQHAAQWQADATQMLLMGHSAGAHLVVLLGSKPDWLRQAGAQLPRGIIALDSGALDVPALMSQPHVPQLYQDAFGSDPAGWAAASPQQQLGRNGLPMLLVCASARRFPTSPCDEARKLAQRALSLSVPVQVLPQALAHGEINRQLGLPSAYSNAVNEWIHQRLIQISR